MYLHKHPFADGNLVSSTARGSHPTMDFYAADLVVCMRTMRTMKDRYNATTKTPHRTLIRLYEAIEADEKVLVLT